MAISGEVSRRAAVILFFIYLTQTVVWAAVGEVTARGTAVIHGGAATSATDEQFICATIDWWPSDKCDYDTCSWGDASILNLDLSNPNLLNAVKALHPLRLRLGGSLQDEVIYESEDLKQQCSPFVKNDSALFGFNEGCLQISRWDRLNEFFMDAGIKAIFGLNALNGRVPMEDGSLGGPWSHKNAESLIRYTAKKGYTIFGWEFGNELSGNGIRARIGVDQYAADTITLKEIVDQIYVGHAIKPLIIAPGGNFEEEWYSKFIELTKDSSSLDVITHHMYILGAGVDEHLTQKILNSSYLDSVAPVFSQLRAVLQNSGTPVTAWVGEAGGAYNSGRNLVTNSFVSSFWYLDQLGMSAKYGMKSYCRQSLIGGYYALLDTTTFKPNPDYYSALLWHHLMGPKVLLTDFIGTKNIRAYCHCAKNSEGITLLLINLDKSTATDVLIREQFNGPQVTDGERKEYHLTAEDGNLNSQTMLLNGRALDVSSNGDLPALNPIRVDGSKPIKIAPLSIVFAHLPYFHALACN